MYTGDKKYDPTVLDNDESAERLRHEEEMQEALKRLSDSLQGRKEAFLRRPLVFWSGFYTFFG